MAGLNAHIVGWGKYLPGKPVTNAELAKTSPVDPKWIEDRVGIQARHYAEPRQASADMGVRAARAALERAQISPQQLELIIAATNTPDYLFPATACLIQDALGAQRGRLPFLPLLTGHSRPVHSVRRLSPYPCRRHRYRVAHFAFSRSDLRLLWRRRRRGRPRGR
jgi:hypothetical protein